MSGRALELGCALGVLKLIRQSLIPDEAFLSMMTGQDVFASKAPCGYQARNLPAQGDAVIMCAVIRSVPIGHGQAAAFNAPMQQFGPWEFIRIAWIYWLSCGYSTR